MKKSILSSRFSKLTQRNQPDQVPSDSERKDLNADVLTVILVKLDPDCVFKCILVNKHWLQVIASPCFRRSYLEKWKNELKVVGFMHKYGRKLVAVNKMGSRINKKKMWTHWQFVNKSHFGDCLTLFFNLETKVYVLRGTGGVTLTSLLPPPPEPEPELEPANEPKTFRNYTTAILSSCNKDGSFKVIRAEVGPYLSHHMANTLNVQTFCSSTSAWELSQLSCCDGFNLLDDPGIENFRGMVYWRATTPSYNRVLVYDTNKQSIRLISEPMTSQTFPKYHYVVSSQGDLECAIIGNENDEIRIWSFYEEYCEWKYLYMVETNWYLDGFDIIKARDDLPFMFVSFVPGRLDSMFVACSFVTGSGYIYIYHVNTHALEKFECKASLTDINGGQLVPFTIADLGVWPSSPSHTKRNKLVGSLKRFCKSLQYHRV